MTRGFCIGGDIVCAAVRISNLTFKHRVWTCRWTYYYVCGMIGACNFASRCRLVCEGGEGVNANGSQCCLDSCEKYNVFVENRVWTCQWTYYYVCGMIGACNFASRCRLVCEGGQGGNADGSQSCLDSGENYNVFVENRVWTWLQPSCGTLAESRSCNDTSRCE